MSPMSTKLLALSLTMIVAAAAQTPQRPQSAVRMEKLEAMKRFAPLVGKWSGSGTYYGNSGTREFVQTEEVESKLEGLVLTVEGVGTTLTGIKVHHAFATITYDPEKKQYLFRTHTMDGAGTETMITPTDTGFSWTAGGGKVRYTATIKDGEWNEIGERAQGDAWHKFIEFKLKKVKA
jgi:hypothetical protein